MIKILGCNGKTAGRIAIVKSYADAQGYAEENRLPAGTYYLLPSAAKTLAGMRRLVVGYIDDNDGDAPGVWSEIID